MPKASRKPDVRRVNMLSEYHNRDGEGRRGRRRSFGRCRRLMISSIGSIMLRSWRAAATS